VSREEFDNSLRKSKIKVIVAMDEARQDVA
jgi:hypothetical protein